MIPDNYNLPPGLAPSNLPGNSRREIAVQRAMEEADFGALNTIGPLEEATNLVLHAFDRDHGPEDTASALKRASEILEDVQAKLDDARHVIGRVLDD